VSGGISTGRFQPSLRLVMVDRALIGRALTNIVDNALHAMPEGAR